MSDPFDIDFKLLPPKLQMQLWVLALDANTSQVSPGLSLWQLSHQSGLQLGGNLEASLGLRRFTAKVENQPHQRDIDLGRSFVV